MHASTVSEEDGTSPPLTSQLDGVTGRSRKRKRKRTTCRGGTETHLSDSECLLSREYCRLVRRLDPEPESISLRPLVAESKLS